MLSKALLLFSLKMCCFAIAQKASNLVLNPSFEDAKRCTENIGNFNSNVPDWTAPTMATTDFFNACAKGETGIPANFIGIQQPRFGQNYAGFYLYTEKNYREYVQGCFSEPLEKGRNYMVSFWVSLAEASDYALKEFGVLLCENPVKNSIEKPLTPKELEKANAGHFSLHPIIGKLYYDDKQNWMQVSTTIVAEGGERHLIIGNFHSNRKTDKTLAAPKRLEIAYYYIDMISVEPTDIPETAGPKPIQAFADAPRTNTSYILENVTFAFDKADLSDTAKRELDKLYAFLNEMKSARIELSGHTDNIGQKKYNLNISAKRAKAVADYLIRAGFAPDRITSQGFGDEKPIETNDSEEGRSRNRRVEFRIVE